MTYRSKGYSILHPGLYTQVDKIVMKQLRMFGSDKKVHDSKPIVFFV